MHTHELLDRFELLYSEEKPILSDLRRAIIDEDLSSIFRIADNVAIKHENIDDFRRAVMEKNLHSVFRVFNIFDPTTSEEDSHIENFRKSITEKNHRAIFRVFTQCGITDELDDLRKAMTEKNLNAVFRLVEQYKDAEIEDIRKTVLEENLHSLFRLLEHYKLDIPLEDLRKAIVEDNLHSIFRIIEMYQEKELIPLSIQVEDIRKAIVEENIHAIFRVLPRIDSENRDLPLIRRFVINKGDDGDEYLRTKELFGLIGLFHQPILLDTLWRVINSFPDANIQDAYSRGQILSKKWLIKELEKLPIDLGTVFLCAGWYGSLSLMLYESGMRITKVRSFDIDDEVWPIAETINRPMVMSEWQFKAQTGDIHDINYKDGHTYNTYRRDGGVRELYDKPDTVINTSCEHIENFSEWYDKIDKGTLVILQTNDSPDEDDHVNIFRSLYEFKEMAPMTDCMYHGELNLDKYNRFMLIGYR